MAIYGEQMIKWIFWKNIYVKIKNFEMKKNQPGDVDAWRVSQGAFHVKLLEPRETVRILAQNWNLFKKIAELSSN